MFLLTLGTVASLVREKPTMLASLSFGLAAITRADQRRDASRTRSGRQVNRSSCAAKMRRWCNRDRSLPFYPSDGRKRGRAVGFGRLSG